MRPNKNYGILKNLDFNKLTILSIKKFVEMGIFVESDFYEDDEIIDDNHILEFWDCYQYNPKQYDLNLELYVEMYNFREEFLITWNELERDKNQIELALEQKFKNEDKLNLIEEYYNDYIKMVKNKPYYLLYKNNVNVEGYTSFFEYFKLDIQDELMFESVINYLKGEHNFVNKPFQDDWDLFFIVKTMTDFCEEKRNFILNPQINNIKNLEFKNDKKPQLSENFILEKNNDLSFQVALFERILKIENWETISATKKGKVLSKLFGKNHDNAKKYYLELEKKEIEMSKKFMEDIKKAEDFIKDILG
jgi:hypothetical protein